jgi:hypothetical protein
LAHEDATHAPPLDDEELDELELLAEQAPALHVPGVQSVHGPPAAPHVVSLAVWHMLLVSQHPVPHEVLSHVAPLLLLVLLPVPLLLEALPELLALLVYELLEEPDPLEPPLLPLPLPLVLRNPEAASVARKIPNSPGATPPLAQATKATAPARATSVSRALGVRRCIRGSVRLAHP